MKRYEMLYFVIAKQILYVLYLQLDDVLPSYYTAYGLCSKSYSIDESKLDFSFWNRSRDDETTRIHLYLEKEDGLMCVKGRCNKREFLVDLREYRIMDIVIKVAIVVTVDHSVFISVRMNYYLHYVLIWKLILREPIIRFMQSIDPL